MNIEQHKKLSPNEKIATILIFIFNKQQFIGDSVDLDYYLNYPKNLSKDGISNIGELVYLLDYLKNENYIKVNRQASLIGNGIRHFDVPSHVTLTLKGLDTCIKLTESGINSNKCFVAISFTGETKSYFDNAISIACSDNGFIAERVDRKHTQSEQTINDLIISLIKQSRFCIADFTHNSMGVYFEAGYALGRGLKVIYTCHEDHFDKRHFDIKPLQFIKYKSEIELREALTVKIKAFIL